MWVKREKRTQFTRYQLGGYDSQRINYKDGLYDILRMKVGGPLVPNVREFNVLDRARYERC
jgi:hypothetical protein